jgi:hypothetical protein
MKSLILTFNCVDTFFFESVSQFYEHKNDPRQVEI